MISLALSLGDPTGIGPEVSSKALRPFLSKHQDAVVTCFAKESALLSAPGAPHLKPYLKSHRLVVVEPRSIQKLPSRPGIASATLALESLSMATDFCLAGEGHVLVTGPVDKSLCARVIKGFTGHTEFLRDRSRVGGTTMLLASQSLSVALVTGHIALKDVARSLSQDKIIATALRVFDYFLNLKARPRIAVCALNPHASDGGIFGQEEAKIIVPALRKLQRQRGATAFEGPFPADTIFHRAGDFDAVICHYHDQGLIPIKTLAFYEAVNITLGLPFLRTSVDHGTAFDIAGKNRASYISMLRALEYAYCWQKSRHSGRRRARA